jgi:hypothetical protein
VPKNKIRLLVGFVILRASSLKEEIALPFFFNEPAKIVNCINSNVAISILTGYVGKLLQKIAFSWGFVSFVL